MCSFQDREHLKKKKKKKKLICVTWKSFYTISYPLKILKDPGTEAHACKPSIHETEVGGL
jgi:hypothetical protein